MNTAPEPAPVNRPTPAATETPIGLGDKLVVILFLIGLALFGLVSLVDLMSNLFR